MNLRHGFPTSISPIPDYLLLDISVEDWTQKMNTLVSSKYDLYKEARLMELIDKATEKGLLAMSYNNSLQLNYRIKALKVVRTELRLLNQ